MFTGIVEELATVRALVPQQGGVRLEIGAHTVLDDVQLGASIAVNGCCLTVIDFDVAGGWWAAEAVIESMQRTNLGDLAVGDRVNLERPVRLSDRLGGHIVQGHVDATGTIAGKAPNPDGSATLVVEAPESLLRYVIEKGSITVDGISLTVVSAGTDNFSIAVIPHTLDVTTLGVKAVGDRVNLEADLIAKYVERLHAVGETGAR